MKLRLCPNAYNETQTNQARYCIEALEKLGHICSLSEEDSKHLFGDESYNRFCTDECDMIISLGGDGSLLRAARVAVAAGLPLIGINSGRLGYLCSVELSEIERFDEILSTLRISKRSLLCLEYEDEQYTALNDIIIAKKNFGETVDLSLHIDDQNIIRVRGDGLIIATPTGSTAYNLSSKGPVIDAECDSFALTPICPHASNASPLVLGGTRTVSISERNNFAEIYVDGKFVGGLTSEIKIHKSDKILMLYSNMQIIKNTL